MDTREAFQLLTLASARDGRTVDVETATVWADDLADVELSEAVAAAKAHYRESERWLMPVHVLHGVRAIRNSRAERHELPGGHVHRWVVDGSCVHPDCGERRP